LVEGNQHVHRARSFGLKVVSRPGRTGAAAEREKQPPQGTTGDGCACSQQLVLHCSVAIEAFRCSLKLSVYLDDKEVIVAHQEKIRYRPAPRLNDPQNGALCTWPAARCAGGISEQEIPTVDNESLPEMEVAM
jgi:hypothetical protein